MINKQLAKNLCDALKAEICDTVDEAQQELELFYEQVLDIATENKNLKIALKTSNSQNDYIIEQLKVANKENERLATELAVLRGIPPRES